jgi:hypothetical protein
VLLAIGQLLIGPPRQAWPDLIVLAVTAFLPLALATRVVQTPGAASAVCGAYLLPRTLISLTEPSIEPPPLLLVPALAFDVSVWLRIGDLGVLTQFLPRPTRVWRKIDRRPRHIRRWRAVLGGAIFGLVLALIAPPWAILNGGDVGNWSGTALWAAAMGNVLGCALIGFSARGTGS